MVDIVNLTLFLILGQGMLKDVEDELQRKVKVPFLVQFLVQ